MRVRKPLPVIHKRIQPASFAPDVVIACDARCDKAWGINNRQRVYFDAEESGDCAYLSDDELGTAPVDPGTYEGGHGKPQLLEERLNKWCFRECERSAEAPTLDDISLPDFSTRRYNMPWLHTEGRTR
jgi:hypothetical protein